MNCKTFGYLEFLT